MSQRQISLALSVMLPALFGAMFLSQYLAFDAHHPTVSERLKLVAVDAKSGDWSGALSEVKVVERVWKKNQALVAIKYSDTSYAFLSVALARLGASVREKDSRSVVRDVVEAVFLFENITSISPSTT